MTKIYIILFFSFIRSTFIFAQTNDCSSAVQFCSGINFSFPSNINTNAVTGPNYGCLGSQPNPTWFYFEVVTPGSIVIDMNNSNSLDIDYICWGPLTTMTNACNNLNTVADCDYSTASANTLTINSAQTAEFYIIMMTNFSGQATNFTMQPNAASTGTTAACRNACPVTVTPSQSFCESETAVFSANVFTADTYTYNWYGPNGYSSTSASNSIPNFSIANAGQYTVIATTGTCVASDTMSLNLFLPVANSTYVINGNTVNFTSTSTNATSGNTWNFGDGFTSNLNNPNHTYASTGVYIVTQIAANYCTTDTFKYIVNLNPLSINNLTFDQAFQIGENPINEALNFKANVALKNLNVKVYSISGELIFNNTLKNSPAGQEFNYNLENLSQGIYILELNAGEKLFTRKIVKN